MLNETPRAVQFRYFHDLPVDVTDEGPILEIIKDYLFEWRTKEIVDGYPIYEFVKPQSAIDVFSAIWISLIDSSAFSGNHGFSSDMSG